MMILFIAYSAVLLRCIHAYLICGIRHILYFGCLAFDLMYVMCMFYHSRFDRDWKKIEAFIGSKTVIQVQ